jgi:hypothetical protein
MARWVCPHCEREFERSNQSHVCVPAGTVDDSFAGHPPQRRAVYDAILDHLDSLGPVHEDATGVGVFLKRNRKLAEVRPRSRDVALWLCLPREVRHPRVTRVLPVAGRRVWHVIPLHAPDDVDDELRGWLTEAFIDASD